MDNTTITIPVDEYKELLKAAVRVEAFADFVNKEKHYIEREWCGSFFGFDINKNK